MVRRVIRIAIVAWLVGAGVQWARRNGHTTLGQLDRFLGEPRRRGTAPAPEQSAQAKLERAAALEAASAVGASADRIDEVADATVTGDDLKVVEGIGPRFDELLRGAGIRSFAGLAAMTPEQIETTIRDAGGRLVNAGTWPAQAHLAATGQWDALAEMQARLKGGREPELGE
jgi:predicted flap endonuclease-1-like 5' DNA nuclease